MLLHNEGDKFSACHYKDFFFSVDFFWKAVPDSNDTSDELALRAIIEDDL